MRGADRYTAAIAKERAASAKQTAAMAQEIASLRQLVEAKGHLGTPGGTGEKRRLASTAGPGAARLVIGDCELVSDGNGILESNCSLIGSPLSPPPCTEPHQLSTRFLQNEWYANNVSVADCKYVCESEAGCTHVSLVPSAGGGTCNTFTGDQGCVPPPPPPVPTS